MINFHFETNFNIKDKEKYVDWVTRIINSENRSLSQIDYIFCTDHYLLEMNQQYLSHNTYTDVITFEYSTRNVISGDIFISIDRIKENALAYGVSVNDELLRVMAHGVLHLMGYKDKTDKDSLIMKDKEEEKIKLFHVEQ